MHSWLPINPQSPRLVFSSVRASWGPLTRQWAGMDASGIHQSNGLVAKQAKGQETKFPTNIGPSACHPCHCFTHHTLDFQPQGTSFTYWNRDVSGGGGMGGRGTPVVLSTSPKAVPVQTMVRTRKLKSGP